MDDEDRISISHEASWIEGGGKAPLVGHAQPYEYIRALIKM